jgi:hypothetical protein
MLSALFLTATSASFAKKEARPVVTFTGMTVHEDRGVTLRVEVSEAIRFKKAQTGKKVSFMLEGAVVRQRTNLFPLITEHFGVEVLSTKLDRVKGGVRFSIVLRDKVELVPRLVEHAAGASLLIDVPPRPAPSERTNSGEASAVTSADEQSNKTSGAPPASP